MDPSPFSTLLESLVARLDGAVAACIVDTEGESVDYAGPIDPFEVRVAAAHWQIIMRQLRMMRGFRTTSTVTVRAQRASFLLRMLADGYVLVVVLSRGAGFNISPRALSDFDQAVSKEAGWRVPKLREVWHGTEVLADRGGRPQCILHGLSSEPLEVLGRVRARDLGLRPRERAYRVRMQSGAERTLVRETSGHWYVDEPLPSERPHGKAPRDGPQFPSAGKPPPIVHPSAGANARPRPKTSN